MNANLRELEIGAKAEAREKSKALKFCQKDGVIKIRIGSCPQITPTTLNLAKSTNQEMGRFDRPYVVYCVELN
jgi:hypothetical protein